MPAPKKAAALKLITGTYRAGRDRPKSVSDRLTKAPPAPSTLSEHGANEWRRLCPIVVRLGTMTTADLRAFELLCAMLGTAAEAEAIVHAEGMTIVNGSGGRNAHPAIKSLETARNQAARLLADFGLTPKGRNSVTAAPVPLDDSNPFRFLVRP
jgi:P27 family predicted phage terminase small subunit